MDKDKGSDVPQWKMRDNESRQDHLAGDVEKKVIIKPSVNLLSLYTSIKLYNLYNKLWFQTFIKVKAVPFKILMNLSKAKQAKIEYSNG